MIVTYRYAVFDSLDQPCLTESGSTAQPNKLARGSHHSGDRPFTADYLGVGATTRKCPMQRKCTKESGHEDLSHADWCQDHEVLSRVRWSC